MTNERMNELEYGPAETARLTQSELDEGWHWCWEFDGLLVGPGCGELSCCSCLPPEHPVYKTTPKMDETTDLTL